MLGRCAPLLLALALAGCGRPAPTPAAGSLSEQQASDRHEAAQESALLAIEREVRELQARDAALEKHDAALEERLAGSEAELARLKASAVSRGELKRALANAEATAGRR